MNKKGRRPRPTGTIKQMNVVNTPSGMPLVLPQLVFSFPQDKDAAEEVAMSALFEQLRIGNVQFAFESYKHHPLENGPDFDVVWNGRQAFVELTELAPLNGPYQTAKRVFTVKEMANLLNNLVLTKNRKYKQREFLPIFLLIYVTDDAFYVAEEVLLVFAHMLQLGEPIIFEAVFFVSFWASGESHMRMPYPLNENLALFNVGQYFEKQVINPNSAHMRIESTDPKTNSVVVRQFLPQGADMSKLVDSIKAMLPGLDVALANEKARSEQN